MIRETIQHSLDAAVQHHRAGRLGQAEQLYRQILSQQPDHAEAMHYLGVIAHQVGRNDDAIDLVRRAIALRSDYAEAHINLGSFLRAKGQLQESVIVCQKAVAIDPSLPHAHCGLGNALKANEQLDEAMLAYRAAITRRPEFAEAHYNLACILKEKAKFDEAIQAYRSAIASAPALIEAYNGLGNCLRDAGQPDQAISTFRQALLLNPKYAEAYNNLALVLIYQSRLDEAIDALRRAIELKPDYADAYNNLGIALKDKGHLDEALAAFRRALAINPASAPIHSNVVYSSHFHSGFDCHAIAKEQREWSRRHAEPLSRGMQIHQNEAIPARRLRIGYLSPNFCDHVVGQNLVPLFRHHDHSQFEIICYAGVHRTDAMTGQLQRHADRWLNIVGLSDEAVAKQIYTDRIDVLVDLTLHMGNNRLLVFARKPAPVQVTYLAYCSSSGMNAMDYRFSDPYLDPDGTDLSCYAEKTLRLPKTYWCYQPGGTAPAPTPPPMLEKGFVTFGCLNNFAKVSSASLELWARILAAVPKSQLRIHASPGTHRDEVAQRMERAGITNNRVHFVGHQSWTAYMQSHSEIDIALDPFPYAGGITTLNALWMGVPVITLSGQTAVGRGGRSILSNLELGELIAQTPHQYMEIAAWLAKDTHRLAELRQSMRSRMLRSPLMDAEGFARDVEAAYRQMWQTWCEKSGHVQ